MQQRAECNSLSWCSQKKQITLSDPKYPDSLRPPILVHITFWPSKNIIRAGVRGAVKKKSLSCSFRFSLWTVGIISQSLPSQPLPWLINIAQNFCSFAKKSDSYMSKVPSWILGGGNICVSEELLETSTYCVLMPGSRRETWKRKDPEWNPSSFSSFGAKCWPIIGFSNTHPLSHFPFHVVVCSPEIHFFFFWFQTWWNYRTQNVKFPGPQFSHS